MDERYAQATGLASTQYGAISCDDLNRLKVDARVRSRWIALGLLDRLGPRSFAIPGSPDTWQRSAWAAAADADGFGYIAGRTAARLSGLDGFELKVPDKPTDDSDADPNQAEVLVTRKHRNIKSPARIASTSRELPLKDTITIGGIRCLKVERLILEAPLFGFSRAEIENAIDSGIRLRLVSEQRLRAKVIKRHRKGINGGRALLEALVDTGGESRLERWFLNIVRRAGLPRPTMRKIWRADSRTIARVDASFGDVLVVELAGHATHSSREARQRDEQRRTELTLRGIRVITFTHEDVRDRPDWITGKLLEAVALLATWAS